MEFETIDLASRLSENIYGSLPSLHTKDEDC